MTSLKMKNPHYLLLIDISMSMKNYERELKKQISIHFHEILQHEENRKNETEIFHHLGFFNDEVYSFQKINNIKEIEIILGSVHCEGGTALFDAIGKGYEYLQKQTNDNGKLLVIFTDGYENNSKHFTQTEVRNLQAINKIEVILVGAGWNVDLPFDKYPIYNLIVKQGSQVNLQEIFSLITSIYRSNSSFSNRI